MTKRSQRAGKAGLTRPFSTCRFEHAKDEPARSLTSTALSDNCHESLIGGSLAGGRVNGDTGMCGGRSGSDESGGRDRRVPASAGGGQRGQRVGSLSTQDMDSYFNPGIPTREE